MDYQWGVDELPDELWEAIQADKDLHPDEIEDNETVDDFGVFPEWDDEPDWRLH